MNLTAKKVAVVDLSRKKFEVSNFTNLHKHIGGLGISVELFKMFEEQDPIIFSIGPLNGMVPFASKTNILLSDGGVIEDLYLGGTLASRLKFTGLDALVLCGNLREPQLLEVTNLNIEFKNPQTDIFSLGLPGRRSILNFYGDKALLDREFTTHEYILERKLAQKGLQGMVITGTESFKIKDFRKFKEIYSDLLQKTGLLTMEKSNKSSCTLCPIGCEKSRFGEYGGNVLVHSLVACQYAEKIFADLGTTFSCLNAIGYDYTHEDLENLPRLIEATLKTIS